MFEKILVCTDGSDNASCGTKYALELALKFNSKVILVNVTTPASVAFPVYAMEAGAYIDTSTEEIEKMQQAILDQAGKTFEDAHVRWEKRALTGQAVDMIVTTANDEQVDLIVIGSRGLGGFSRFLLGSVSDGVLHHAHCPVLVVR